MASGRPRTRSAGQLLHPTAGYGVHPGDTIAVSYDVSRTELWTGTCTGDDRTGLRITWEPPTPRRQHDRPLTADDLANATVVQTAEQAAAAQAQPAVCDYEQQRNAAVARNQAFLGQLSLPAGTGFGSAWTQAHHEALREDVQVGGVALRGDRRRGRHSFDKLI